MISCMELRIAIGAALCLWVQSTLAGMSSYPVAPPPAELERGRALAQGSEQPFGPLTGLFRARRPRCITSVLHDNTVPIGHWFTGWSKKPVEEVIHLSPAVFARWLGFRAQREHWPPEEVSRRWDQIRSKYAGKLVFVIRRSAFPKRPFLDIGDPVAADPESLDRVRFVFTSGGQSAPLWTKQLGRVHGDSKGEMEFAWWTTEAFFEVLAGEFEQPHPPQWRHTGTFTSVWDLAWVEEPDWMLDSFEVRVLTPSREKVASFRSGR